MANDPWPPEGSPRNGVRPRPGARAANPVPDPFAATAFGSALPPAAGSPPPAAAAAYPASHDADPGLPVHWAATGNPLVDAAHPLLALITQIRGSARHPDPAALREELARAVARFEQDAAAGGAPRDAIVAARYLLCTFVDETAAGTPWGGQGAWAASSLLVRFHNETWGGEKSFQLLARLSESPQRNRALLELFSLCLALGFEGRFRVLPDGRAQLDRLRERLALMIREQAPAADPTLSTQWAPAAVARRHWFSAAPYWVFGVLVSAAAIGSYLLYSATLAGQSDQAFARLAALRLGEAPRPVAAAVAAAPAVRPRLATLLADEAAQGLLTVSDTATRSVVVLKGDLSFDPGSAQVSARMRPVLDKVGRALAAMPGSVLISGHTDAIPIRTARFPSNWHLSRDRAEAVKTYLARVVPASRMQADGRADSESIASNETVQGRADNRRVEINLFVTQ
ncbi:MAG: type VI secretion system protein TssL, long form [Lautropia sp.]